MGEEVVLTPIVAVITEAITQSGESLVVPEKFTHLWHIGSALNLRPWELLRIQKDSKTNLIIENSVIRSRLVEKIDNWIRIGKPLMFVQVDADNLKTFNEDRKYGRDVGDLLIKRSAAQSLRVIDNAVNLTNSNISVAAVRPTHAADELEVWIFCNDENEVVAIKKLLPDIDDPIVFDDGKNSFSSTAVFAVSSEASVVRAISEYKQRVISSSYSRQKARPYEVLKAMKNTAGVKAQLLKDSKLILSLPEISSLLRTNIKEFEQAVIIIKNNHRGAEAVERIIHRLTRIHEKLGNLTEQSRDEELKRIKEGGYLGLFPELTDRK